MKKFMVIYHATPEATQHMTNLTPTEQETEMKTWYTWRDTMGTNLVDFGAPLMPGVTLTTKGNVNTTPTTTSGYSIIQATDLTQAQTLLKNHPHITNTNGCDIEIHEITEM